MLNKKWFRWTAGIVVVLALVLWVTGLGEALLLATKLISRGQVQLGKSPKTTYTADRTENLKSLQNALVSYADLEGAFPPADRWMDAIKQNLRPTDMKEGEELKKLKNPAISGGLSADQYGYRFNASLAGKSLGEVKDHKTVVVEESPDDLTYNANGQPKQGKGTWSADVDGNILTH